MKQTYRDVVIRAATIDKGETIIVPGDKSISHRAVLLAALSPGETVIRNINRGFAVTDLFGPMRALGVSVTETDDDVRIGWLGDGDAQRAGIPVLNVGPSSAAARLLIGILAGLERHAVVDGSDTLRKRPMDWLVDPLRTLGANIEYLGEEGCLPVRLSGGKVKSGRVTLRVGSAQARSGIVLAAAISGTTVEIEYPVLSRDHTERLLSHLGIPIEAGEKVMKVRGGAIAKFNLLHVPGDPSLAAYPVARHILSGSKEALRIAHVCLNPTRTGFFDVLRGSGAPISFEDVHDEYGEPVGTVVVDGNRKLRPFIVDDPFTFHSLIDEVPLLCAIAVTINGVSRVSQASELSFKETNRLKTVEAMLRGFGAKVEADHEQIVVHGGRAISAGATPSGGDHRIAMAAAVLASVLGSESVIQEGSCYTTSYPEFPKTMSKFGCEVRSV